MNKTGNMNKKLGKQERLDFQKMILECLHIAKRTMKKFPDNEEIKKQVEAITTEYLAEKKRIENDYKQ